MLRHSAATGVATGKIGSKQRQRPIQKHAGKSSIDRKTAPHLSEHRNLLICDAHNCERVVKTFQTSLRKNKELRTASDFSPSMLLYGTQSLFRTNFPRCHALLGFLTSSLASPMAKRTKRVTTSAYPFRILTRVFFFAAENTCLASSCPLSEPFDLPNYDST